MGNYNNYYRDHNGNNHQDIPIGTSPADAYVRTNIKLTNEIKRLDDKFVETNDTIQTEIARIEQSADNVERQLESNIDNINMSIRNLSDSLGTRMTSEVTAVNSRIENIIANNNNTEGNSELVDIRTGTDGTVYASAGLAVRTQVNSVMQDLEAVRNDIDIFKSDSNSYGLAANDTLQIVKRSGTGAGQTVDLSILRMAIKSLILHGTDTNTKYFLGCCYSSDTTTDISVYDENNTLLARNYNSDTYSEEVTLNLAEYENSGVTGTITVDFSLLPSVAYRFSNYLYNYEISGLENIKTWPTVPKKTSDLTNDSNFVTVEEFDSTEPEIVVPDTLHCVVSHNCNINLDNTLLYGNYENEKRYLVANKTSLDGEIELVPPSSGSEQLLFRRYSGAGIKAYKAVSFTSFTAPNINVTQKMLMLGDSTTQFADSARTLMLSLFNDVNIPIQFVGTQGTENIMHEGRGGWTTQNYMESQKGNKVNPFFDGNTFSFSYYCQEHPDCIPDIVIINLGINDLSADITTAQTIENLNHIIDSIKDYRNDTIILLALPNLPSAFRNIWTYAGGIGRKNALLKLIKAYIAEYGSRENENIFISPIYLYLNPKWDMQYREYQVNCRNSKTVYGTPDGTHPSDIGYQKFGDCYFNDICYALSENNS